MWYDTFESGSILYRTGKGMGGKDSMTLADLINHFIRVKQEKPSNVNQLLDFLQRCYIMNEYNIVQYRDLYRKLKVRGASKPGEKGNFSIV